MDREKIRQRLLDRQAALRAVADSASDAAGTVTLDQTRVGRLSRMDALSRQAIAQVSLDHQRRELAEIAAALDRIERGHYGDCERCGEPVEARRLQAMPAAALCLSCAARAETG